MEKIKNNITKAHTVLHVTGYEEIKDRKGIQRYSK
jgi:hypothetical protein